MSVKQDIINGTQSSADSSGDLELRASLGDPVLGPVQLQGETEQTGQAFNSPGFTDSLIDGVAAGISSAVAGVTLQALVYQGFTNSEIVQITEGEYVSVSGNSTFARVASPVVVGLLGVVKTAVNPGTSGDIIYVGRALVRLEDGLTPLPNEPLYLGVTPGRLTNIDPGSAILVGHVIDASGYATVTNPFVLASLKGQ